MNKDEAWTWLVVYEFLLLSVFPCLNVTGPKRKDNKI